MSDVQNIHNNYINVYHSILLKYLIVQKECCLSVLKCEKEH